MPPPQALAIARTKGLDLVEIAATAVPPVCRIMDFGRYQYQEQKRARSAKKHQKIIEVKEIKFRPKVDEHDYQFKKKHIERFLADGDKVKATIFFRGREMAHPEIGRRILERLIDDLADVATPENMPRQEGNQMHTILSQKAGGKKPVAKVKATIFFRGREMAHPEIGRRILERLIEDLTEVAIAETAPRQEGNQMHTILSGKAGKKPAAKKEAAEPKDVEQP